MSLTAAVIAACGIGLIGAAIVSTRRATRHSPRTAAAPVTPQEDAATIHRLRLRDFEARTAGWLRIAPANQLLELVQASQALEHMARQSKLSHEVWCRDLLCSIERYAEFVQLMPASEAHHHAHAGGLLSHTLEMTLAAMTWRNGHFFPEGATAEIVSQFRDEWTYVVFFAALLHDIGKPMTDLRIQWRHPGLAAPVLWSPVSGALTDLCAGAGGQGEYLVEFTPKASRNYAAHSRMAILLLQQIAPQSALSFLARCPAAFEALSRYLSGEDRDSLLAKVISKADRSSARHALLNGPKARFESAASVPLVELLMGSMRTLLQDGSLPLNRSGAAGWVHDGAVWFVAKRLADTIRDHVRRVAPSEGIPGDSKNDRFFDTWQDYGCIELNPNTGGAIWYVTIHGTAGSSPDAEQYAHTLSVLKFPLAKIYADGKYPEPMLGHITLAEKGAAVKSSNAVPSAGDALSAPDLKPAVTTEDQQPDTASAEPAKTAAKSAVKAPQPVIKAPTFGKPATSRKTAASSTPEPSSPTAPAEHEQDTSTFTQDKDAADLSRQSQDEATPGREIVGIDDFLDEDWDIAEAVKARSVQTGKRSAAPQKPRAPASVDSVKPVLLVTELPSLESFDVSAGGAPQAGKDGPSEAALAFAQWLQTGLAAGSLTFNEAGAMIHFVPEGMGLVSPLIFRQYIKDCSEELPIAIDALKVQKDVLKAGWHAKGLNNTNIINYLVVKRGGIPVSRLSLVVFRQPGQWVQPVPPPNASLQRAVDPATAA